MSNSSSPRSVWSFIIKVIITVATSPQKTQRTQRKGIIYGEKILCTLW